MGNNISFFKNQFIFDDGVYVHEKKDGYVENFGKQWKDYRDIQLDSQNNFDISQKYLEKMIFDDLSSLKNKTILEIGCGAGRFTEHFSKYSKMCISVDLSSAAYHNISKNEDNIKIIKADFTKLIPDEKFDIVFCRGVLQHTPDPFLSILKMYSFVKKDGFVFFDIYRMPKIGYAHPKYLFWRPVIKKIFTYEKFKNLLERNINKLLICKKIIKKISFGSNFISDLIIPIWNYENQIKLTKEQNKIWSIMDTLDGIYAKYDYPQKYKKIIKFLLKNNINIINTNKEINSFHTKLN